MYIWAIGNVDDSGMGIGAESDGAKFQLDFSMGKVNATYREFDKTFVFDKNLEIESPPHGARFSFRKEVITLE